MSRSLQTRQKIVEKITKKSFYENLEVNKNSSVSKKNCIKMIVLSMPQMGQEIIQKIETFDIELRRKYDIDIDIYIYI